MITKILRGSFARPALTLILVLASCALGAVWLQDLRCDVFPDLSAPVFNVIVQNPTMGAEELETGVAIPLEVALAGLPEVRRIRSSSLLGVTQVTVEFESDADYYRARQFVAERVNQAASQLPPGTEAPNISSLTGRLNEIFEFTIEAEPGTADPMVLRDLAEFEVRNRLLAVPGVASIERLGGYLRQFQIQLDPERMSARSITLDDVEHAVQGANMNAAGGFVTEGSMEWTVRAVGRASNVEDLRSTVVAMKSKTVPVLLGDIADIREAPAVRRGIAHRLNGEVVSCRVIKQFGADTVKVSAGIRKALDEIGKTLPKGVQLRAVYDQSELIASSLGGVERAILIGAVLVILVLFLLLGDIRAALIVTLTLPLSIALSGLLLKPLGIGINTMTLGGLAIAVGLLVDAAIIVTENIVHRITLRHTNGNRKENALAAAVEVSRPIAFATLIVTAVFLPLFAMSGIEGKMYSPLAAAVVSAIAASLILAITLVPVVAATFLRPKASVEAEDVWIVRKLKSVYAPLLDYALRHRVKVLAGAAVVTVPTLVLALYVGSDFMPKLDEGAFLIQTVLPAEASLDEVDRVNHRIEDALRTFPEVEDVVRRTGRAERSEDPMPHTWSDVLVILKPNGRSGEDLEQAMRSRLQTVAGATALFTTPLGMRIDEGLGGTPADISVRIFGSDLDKLAGLGERAQELMRDIRGIADLRTEKLTGMPQLKVGIDRQAVARVGLTPGDVIRAIRVGMAGEEESEIWIGQRRFEMVLRLQDEHRNSPKSIGGLLIDGHDGSRIPLNQLAKIEQTFGPGTIRREAGSRRIAVEADVHGRDLGSTAAEINEKLSKELALPTGYFFNVGGRVESQTRAVRSLSIAIAVAGFAVFLLLYIALGSAAEAAVIVATLPTASVGGIVALLIAGETWNVSSLVGLIGLFGIAVQNGLVLITQTRGFMAEGLPFETALRSACIGRVRPKIMTAATAILGLLPLLVLRLHGTEIERPLAVVMIGGLVTSTLFTLLALPTFYMGVHQLQEKLAGVLGMPQDPSTR